MDLYQRQRQSIIKISNYFKKTLGKIPVSLDYLKWEFGNKEAIPTKFVVSAVEKILEFDLQNKFKLFEGEIIENE